MPRAAANGGARLCHIDSGAVLYASCLPSCIVLSVKNGSVSAVLTPARPMRSSCVVPIVGAAGNIDTAMSMPPPPPPVVSSSQPTLIAARPSASIIVTVFMMGPRLLVRAGPNAQHRFRAAVGERALRNGDDERQHVAAQRRDAE